MALIVWLFALMRVVSSATSSCDTPVMISENSTKYPFSKESLILYCNASSYDQINWYHIPVGTTDLNPYQLSWCTPDTCRLRGNSTILVMGEISMELKDSKIICVASCSATGKNATAYTTVSVIKCVPLKPILKPVQNVTTSLGETANLTCKAKMGTCYDLTFPNFIWARNGTKISKLNTTKRYSTYVELDVTGELVTTLTIRDVKEEDLQSFDCTLVDNHFRDGHDRMTVILSLSESRCHVFYNNSYIAAVVIVPIVVFGILCYCCCRWRIQYFLKKKSLKERGVNKEWDALLWHDNEHSKDASNLLAALEGMRYRVCTKEDRTCGPKLDCLEAQIDSSACVIILRKDDGKMMTILDKAQENQSVILIQTKSQSFKEKVNHLKCKFLCHTRRNNLSQSKGELNKSMAGFLKLYWPSHDANVNCCATLRRAEFYYRLRLKLPKSGANVELGNIQMQ
ncbi:uncharacterized protein LOC128177957 [Crassostrea angulata]|uniref:uncharacterized protein LOC128177957 n=1 Tax=Magallana angulata TaxID=2784310 RepID=UPI0022B1D125|nr:uncharacterized protein LOC128177957 [Crassostrea angulata]XP_052700855.1 uncharacterized protein LOC128177957 [Crassostrea angulata]